MSIWILEKGEMMREYISAAGEDLASESSDTKSDEPKSRHHLLRHKLTLDEGAASDKAVPESEVGKQENKRRARRRCLICKRTCDVKKCLNGK